MILVDVNILIYAHVSSFGHHPIARNWLDQQLNGSGPVGLPWASMLAFLRLVTNPRVFENPEPIGDAWRQVHEWLACETAWIPQPTERHAELLGEFLALPGIYGNLVPDAHPTRYDPEIGAEIEELACHLAGDTFEPREQDLAMQAAEAQFELLRAQGAKVDLINGIAKHPKYTDPCLSEGDRLAFAFMRKSKTLAAFDRYERRATSRRNRLLRKLRALQELNHRRAAVEQVGPPRPKKRVKRLPFVEDVWILEVHQVVKHAVETWPKTTLPDGSSSFHMGLKWGPEERPYVCTCIIYLNGDRGSLVLVNPQLGEQSFALSRVSRQVGGGKWLVRCLETNKMVESLYLGGDGFASRHVLKLHYLTKTMPAWERHSERCQREMDRIGATDPGMLPPRPKYMHRATYHRICDNISTENLLAHFAFLGPKQVESLFAMFWLMASRAKRGERFAQGSHSLFAFSLDEPSCLRALLCN